MSKEIMYVDLMKKEIVELSVAGYPFSFIYNGIPSERLLNTWQRKEQSSQLEQGRLRQRTTFSDSQTGLRVICVATFFTDYPAVDWVLYFENTGVADTPIIENIQVLDVLFNKPLPGKTPWLLHQTNGAQTTPEDMETRKVPRADDEAFSMGGALGMSTGYDLPYFRIDMAGASAIIAVGWSGQWKADLQCHNSRSLHITAGMERTHIKLHAGEKVRTPRLLMLLWEGEGWQSNVQFRRLLYNHYVPAFRDKKPEPFIIFNSYFTVGFDKPSEEKTLPLIPLVKPLGVEIFQ